MTDPSAGTPITAQAALASPPRRRLLELLRASETPLDAPGLAAATGLHVTTVRFHLDVLRQVGLVTARPEPRGTAGRPRVGYAAVTRVESGGYPTLTRLLAGQLGDTPPARAARAEQAGVGWARELTAAAEPSASIDLGPAAQAVTSLFAELGFDPELTGQEMDGAQVDGAQGDRRIWLRACPFRAAARVNPEVVCSVHLGLLRGILDRLGAPPTASRLLPFVEPELCRAELAPR